MSSRYLAEADAGVRCAEEEVVDVALWTACSIFLLPTSYFLLPTSYFLGGRRGTMDSNDEHTCVEARGDAYLKLSLHMI